MEEVDKIILRTLKEINCEFEDDAKLIRHLTCENIVEAFARCLNIINPSLNIPTQLPPSMGERFKLGAAIANACKDLGCKDNIGYQTFLYSNEIEIRRLFTFVIERLPKEQESKSEEGGLSSFYQDVSKTVKGKLGQEKPCLSCKKLFLSVPLETGVSLPGVKRDISPQEWCRYCQEQLPFLDEQTSFEFLLPSIITLNSRGILCPSQLNKKIKTPSVDVAEGVAKLSLLENQKESQFDEEIGSTEKTKDASSTEETDDEEKNEEKIILELEMKVQELTSQTETERKKLAQVNEEISLHTKTYESNIREDRVRLLLTQGDESFAKLKQLAEDTSRKLLRLSEQWEQHRTVLIQQYRNARSQVKLKSNSSDSQVEAVQKARNTLRSLLEELKKKHAKQLKLEKEVAILAKNQKPPRSAYTQRVMEIISNVDKQNNEINKIVTDTKELQREVNNVTGRLDRVFAVADDLIFQAAKRDEAARRAYKLLVALHSDCAEIVNLVEETGAIMRESKDLEEEVRTESAKNVSENLNLVLEDLKKIREEKATTGKRKS